MLPDISGGLLPGTAVLIGTAFTIVVVLVFQVLIHLDIV